MRATSDHQVVEADSRKDFERITDSLPTQRARIQHAVDRYAAAGLRCREAAG
ncbi:MAG: hypothetical protein U0361_20275 [Nitrospiraceae bacterium]